MGIDNRIDSSPSNRYPATASSDETNEYNNSLNFGSKVPEKVKSLPVLNFEQTQRDSLIQTTPFLEKLQEEFNETEASLPHSSPTPNVYSFHKQNSIHNGHDIQNTQLNQREDIRFDDTQVLSTPNIDTGEVSIAQNNDTQVIQQNTQRIKLDDTQMATPNSTGNDTQQIESNDIQFRVSGMEDTQKIVLDDNTQGSDAGSQKVALDDNTQRIEADTQKIVLDDNTQRIEADTQRLNPLYPKDTQVIDGATQKDTVIQSSPKLYDDNEKSEGFLTFSHESQSSGKEASSPYTNNSFIEVEDPRTSPDSVLLRSTVQIPGTVERSHTQVLHTQEEISNDIIEDEESVGTDTENMIGVYDDSILTHKLNLKRRLENSSPSKETQVIRSPPLEAEEEFILPSKRKRRNVIESQSQPSQVNSHPTNNSLEPISQSTNSILLEETSMVLKDEDVLSKDSVWATYKFKMYPGRILSVHRDKLEIVFEEGYFEIDNADLYPLDIRIGDIIQQRGSRVQYIITGLGRDPNQDGQDICCIRGYNQVHMKRKSPTRKASEETVCPLSNVLMDLTQWYQHQEKYTVDINTHSFATSVAAQKTPTRRHTQERHSDIKAPESRGVFSNSLFCITSMEERDKQELVKLITSHGGLIVDEGFIALFTTNEDGKLELRDPQMMSDISYVALISNGVSRSSKYLQTVALGWPILSEYFIHDTVETPSNFNNWPSYLLGAGHSSILGSIKSLDVYKFRAGYEAGHSLDKQISINSQIFSDYMVIGLGTAANSKELEVCQFILKAFGVKHLLIKPSIADIKSLLKSGSLDPKYILLYDNSHSLQKVFPKYKVITWEWVVQCCISNRLWS